MPLHLNGSRGDRCTGMGFHRYGLCDSKGETLGCPPGLQELRQWGFYHRKGQGCQSLLQFITGGIEHHDLLNVDGITGKIDGICFTDGNPFGSWNPHLNQAIGVCIKGRWIVEQVAATQGTKARIQMIEALINQPQRQDFNVEPFCQIGMGVQF